MPFLFFIIKELTMRFILALVATAAISSAVMAQQAQRSSDPTGVQIQGNTEIKAEQKDATATAKGEGSTATNTAGAIKGGTQIQGNTKIKATQKNVTATASGKNSKAANEAGVIGGQ
ncbi:MAG: hypothetical protein IPH35_22650 [Rhodoferax sp.]|nr:hypothetical protein [Rhodoferax sp.]